MKLASIQVMRAAAVVGVVLFHYGRLAIGEGGVDLFFVISGLIMARVIPGKGPAAFARARLHRIFPPYLAATALILATGQAQLAWKPILDSLLILPGGQLYLPQAWTLAFELTFYAGCVAYMMAGRSALLLLALAWLFGSLGYYIGIAGSPLFLEFFLGVGVSLLPRRYGIASLVTAALLCFALHGQHRLFAFGIPAALLTHAALCFEGKMQRWAIPILVGDASYSIYLTHWTFMALMPTNLWLLEAYIAILLGIAFYFAVERPLVRHAKLSVLQTYMRGRLARAT